MPLLKRLARRAVLSVVLTTAAASLCSMMKPDARADEAPAIGSVAIDNFTFGPAAITVPVGATVTWTNRDDIPHTVVETKKTFKSKPLDTGDTFSFTFSAAGEYDYFCSLHPHMTGKVIVKAATP